MTPNAIVGAVTMWTQSGDCRALSRDWDGRNNEICSKKVVFHVMVESWRTVVPSMLWKPGFRSPWDPDRMSGGWRMRLQGEV